jgi:hypothetical protein
MSEQLAEPVHRDLERVRGRRRWLLAPECVDQALRWKNLVAVKDQKREQ